MRLGLSLAFCLSLAAQDSRFNVRSRLVLVPVTVSRADGHSVDGLDSADFLVLDDHQERKVLVDTISTGVAPIALAIVVQSSGIATPVLEKVRKIGAMIQPLITGERGCAAVASFAESVTWLQECTSNSIAIERALRAIQPGQHSEAAMLDAVSQAIERLRARPNSRRVLLLVSESRDRGSKADLKTATIAAQTADIAVYAFTYSAYKTAFTSKAPLTAKPAKKSPQTTSESEAMHTANGAPPSSTNPYSPKLVPANQSVNVPAILMELLRLGEVNTTQALAAATGGTTIPFTTLKGLESAIQKLSADLHSQYFLSFAPPQDAPPGFHTLEVRLTRPGTFHIRARPGYWTADTP